jgi:hypothetical protein
MEAAQWVTECSFLLFMECLLGGRPVDFLFRLLEQVDLGLISVDLILRVPDAFKCISPFGNL